MIPEQVRPVCVKDIVNAEQLRPSVLDQITCTPDTHHQPGVYHSTPLDFYHHNEKAIYCLPHPESSIPQLSSQEWQPVVREKADIIIYWLASEFSEGLIKTNYIIKSATALELICSTQLTITTNWGCTWIGAFD